MVRKKNENVFKFKKFADRIQEVDLRKSAFFKIENANETLDESVSYFHQNYQKWSVLNLTDEFAKFQNKIRNVVTLPQLLLEKERVINLLLERLRDASSLSLQPLLEFVVVLAKDLREDFYQYFPEFFELLISLLQKQHADQTEWILICLAFLFKILKSFIRKDLQNVVRQILPLLDEQNQPDHIINFAVECFSFVSRDIKDKDKFILMMLSSAESDENYVMGCGKLFFEMLKGLNGQLHSSSESFLNALLESFLKPEFQKYIGTLYEILVQTFGDLLNYTNSKHCEIFWNAMYKVFDQALKEAHTRDTYEASENVEYLIRLLGQAVEFRDGKKISDLVQIINYIIKIIQIDNFSEQILLNASQIGALILHSNNFNLTQLDASRLSKKILNINNKNVFEKFVMNSIGYSQFDLLILPDFLKYFELNFNENTLEILVKILSDKNYNLSVKKSETVAEITKIIVNYKLSQIKESETFLLTLTCIPHFANFKNNVQIQNVLQNLINEIITILKRNTRLIEEDVIEKKFTYKKKFVKIDYELQSYEDQKRYIYLLTKITTVLNDLKNLNSTKLLNIINVVLPYCASTKYGSILNFLNFLIESLSIDKMDLKLFETIQDYLSDNLMSQYHQIRLNTTRILKNFDHLKVASINDDSEESSIYSIFYGIESTEPNVQTYRDQILLLQKLDWNSTYFEKVRDSPYKKDALKYCLGFLNVNFQLLWEPVKAIIHSYSDGFDKNEFWSLFKERIEFSVTACRNYNDKDNDIKDNEMEDDNVSNHSEEELDQVTGPEEASNMEFVGKSEYLTEIYNEYWHCNEKIDYIKYRVTLWNIISEFNNFLFNDKNHDLVNFFLDFIDNEYNCEEKNYLARQKLLIAHLTVFSKITCPKHIHKEKEIRKLYMEFILHRNFQVQRLALDCLLQYKESWLLSYKDLLYNLLDEKKFRSELLTLNLNEKINEDHRENFIEIFLAILYTKLTTKVVKNDNEGFTQKKETIVRFLSNLSEPEMTKLTYISIGYLKEYIDKDFYESVLTIQQNVNVKGNQLQSTLNFIDLVRKNVAGLFSSEYHKFLLKIILCISSFAIKPQNSLYKNLKQTCLSCIVNFFEQFDQFVWDDQEIELLFNIFVTNQLNTFCNDNSQNVTGLMKLFVEWSKNPKYFVLLGKASNENNYPLKSIIMLLNHKTTTNSVVECIMDIVERLLTLKTDESLFHLKNIQNYSQDIEYNYGTLLLEPFVMDILVKMKEFLNSKQNRNLNKRNLVILSRITELVTSKESSKMLLDILFPLTLKKCQEDTTDSDSILKLLTTISNLLNFIDNKKAYVRQIAPLLEHMHEVNLRKNLLQIFNQIFEDENEITSIINDLNAYDKRWIEQPDHERRLSVFRKLDNLMSVNNIDIDLGILIVYQCFYYLKYEKDLAIRDNASHYLKLVILNVIAKYKDDNQSIDLFVDKIIMNLIQKKLKEGKSIQTETILLLGELARKCPDIHPVLTDLKQLTNEKVRDLDFFDNVTHLQKFRHMKALRKFNEVAKTLKHRPNLRTLTEILLPISKIFLCAGDYRRKSKIIEAAIEFVSIICKFLPWAQYEAVLKFYLKKMSSESIYQKQLIKLIPAILDAFHFDLSAADVNSCEIEKIQEKSEDIDELELENDNEDLKEEVDEEIHEKEDEVLVNAVTKLNASMAKRVITHLSRRLIPSLLKAIHEQINYDKAHKLNKEDRRSKEKSDMLRIPMALTVVKLLQKLPKKFMDDNLSALIFKVCSFLKSTLKQVRSTARLTLNEIIFCLGTSFIETVLSHLSSLLSKGFQVHVLSVTTHSILDRMKKEFKQGDADKIMQLVLNICLDDIFKKFVNNDNIGKMARRTPEAKPSRKSFLSLNILAANISEKSILDLLIPFKEQLIATQSKKVVNKVQECLQKIVAGLTINSHLSVESLMILSYGTMSESIPDLLSSSKKQQTSKSEREMMKRSGIDSYLILPEPKRRGALSINQAIKINKQTNSHILSEFGLEILNNVLKRKTYLQIEYESFLDPIIAVIVNALKSSYVRVIMLSIKCITSMWANKLELPKMQAFIDDIVKDIFDVLHKYAMSGSSKKDNNFLLVKSAFKSIIILLKRVTNHNLSDNQLKTLILYIEQDLYNHDKQTMVFLLLKTIIERKLMVPELQEIMKKIFEISITSELASTQEVCRQIILVYLMEYPIEKKIEAHIKFFIAQLNYDVISGRMSSIQMLILMFKNFPQIMLRKFSGLFFLSLGARLVNDESTDCKKMIAEALELLLKQIDNNPKQQLFDLIISLLEDRKLVHREMGAQLCNRFINAEGEKFASRLNAILPEIVKSLTNEKDEEESGRFVKIKKLKLSYDTKNEDDIVEEEQTVKDHHLIQTLNTILKIFEMFENEMQHEKYQNELNKIGWQAHYLLANEHLWVRINALKVINFYLKTIDVPKITNILKNPREAADSTEFLYSPKQLKSVTLDMCVQLKPDTDEELLLQIMNNLLFVANILKNVEFGEIFDDKKDFNLLWLIRRLRYAIHAEIAQAPKEIMLRKQIFQFFEALVALIDNEILMKLAISLLNPIIREAVDGEHTIPELKTIAIHVGNEIKKKIGTEAYDKIRLELQSKMLKKRVERRKTLAQDRIRNPVKAAERKIVKQLKKQDNRKRKIRDIQDGIILPKKKKFSLQMNINEL